MVAEDAEGEKMAEKKGDLLIELPGPFQIIDVDGQVKEKTFKPGRHYGIDTVTHYDDGYVDILFENGTTLPQINLTELGYYIGKPEVIDNTNKKEEEATEKPKGIFSKKIDLGFTKEKTEE